MGKDLVKIESFLPFKEDTPEVTELMDLNLGGVGEMSVFDLPRVKMPSAGNATWSVPTLEGDQTKKAIVGIILAWQPSRGYWPGEFSGSMPPQCSSADGKMGAGDPGGECAVCPLAKWESAEKGRGQACKAMVRMLVLESDSILPIVLTLPPTSIKAWRAYGTKLLAAQVPYYGAVSEIGLEQKQNQEGIAYSVATFAAQTIIEGEQRAQVKGYAAGFREMLGRLTVQADDYEGGVEL